MDIHGYEFVNRLICFYYCGFNSISGIENINLNNQNWYRLRAYWVNSYLTNSPFWIVAYSRCFQEVVPLGIFMAER